LSLFTCDDPRIVHLASAIGGISCPDSNVGIKAEPEKQRAEKGRVVFDIPCAEGM